MPHPSLALPVALLWIGLALRLYPRFYVTAKENTFREVDVINEVLIVTNSRSEFFATNATSERVRLIESWRTAGLVLILLGLALHIAVVAFGHIQDAKQYIKFFTAHAAPLFMVAPILYFQFSRSKTTGLWRLRNNRDLLKFPKIVFAIIAGWVYVLSTLALLLLFFIW
jgi:hypothetical protein